MLKALFGWMTALLSIIGIVLSFIFTYIPWIESDDGDYVSISAAHDQCQNEIVALFASQDCANVESLWLIGNGCCGLSSIFLIFSLILVVTPSRKKERPPITIIQNDSQMYSANCPKCGALHIGSISQMQGRITCGICGTIYTTTSLQKYNAGIK